MRLMILGNLNLDRNANTSRTNTHPISLIAELGPQSGKRPAENPIGRIKNCLRADTYAN
jgi:hypothetical protein